MEGVEKIFLFVNPGICGFECTVSAQKLESPDVEINIIGSECKKIIRLSKIITKITLQELYLPFTENPVFLAMECVKCHTSCPLSTAILKAAEIAFGMALPKAVNMRFLSSEKGINKSEFSNRSAL